MSFNPQPARWALMALTLATAAPASAETMLFVGNSFTFGAYSPVWHYRAGSVTDLNGGGVGGVPALFKLYGSNCIFTPVNDRPREVGVTKSDYAGRAIKGLYDLLGVLWLTLRTPAPDRGNEE